MKNQTIAIVVILLVLVGVGAYFVGAGNLSTQDDVANHGAMMQKGGNGEVMMKKDGTDNDSLEVEDGPVDITDGYVRYSEEAFQEAVDAGMDTVLYFNASWCPMCQALDAEFERVKSEIPDDVVIFKTDYDDEVALKQKHGVTVQHTFVHVDENGDKIGDTWFGGDLNKVLQSINYL
ncbi:thioredoxin family protein [Candidatus Dojkabacteria bacterium]|uniref:Thioredoxin family protein n=1 Tax=Candidatus Dojkabacteria bacterium TaxID=2099670 RepID=A0A955RK69_9BACT|nr:thioredoxin family protein [Candidatus Dojkabacteria bacterium]